MKQQTLTVMSGQHSIFSHGLSIAPEKRTCQPLGFGLLAGSLTLIGGDPGVGKSTLLLQLAGILANTPAEDSTGFGEASVSPVSTAQAVLYVSAEESVEQVHC